MRITQLGPRRRRHIAAATSAMVLALAALSGCMAAGPSPNFSPPRNAGSRAPASIPGDCSRDVTRDILAWVASVPDGTVLQFAPNGCYRIDGTLHFEDRNGLTFEGNGATFKPSTDGTELGPRGARNRAQFFFVRGSNITLQDMTIRGALNLGLDQLGYDLEAQHGIVVGQTNGFHVTNVHVSDVYGDMVYVGPYTHDVVVDSSVFARSGRQGWDVAGGSNITFDRNSISDIAHATIDLEPPDTGAVSNLTISNNTISSGRLFFFNIGGAAVAMSDFRILNNVLVNKPMKVQAAVPGTLKNFTISGNRVSGPIDLTGVDQSGGGAFFIQNATNVMVTNNQVSMTWGRNITGVNLGNTHGAVVTDNVWTGGAGSVSYWDGLDTGVCWSRNLAYSPLAPEPSSGGRC